MVPQLSGFSRFLLAFSAFLKVWFDRTFAERVWAVQHGAVPALPAAADAPKPETVKPAAESPPKVAEAPAKPAASTTALGAAHLLAILQRDGRLVDFLQEDLGDAPDADLAAVVRSTVYSGCRKALQAHLKLAPVSERHEGDMITVEPGFDAHAIRLTGNVVGSPPFKGTLRHRGWKVVEASWPEPPAGYDGTIVAPAEVELP
jgi:hypothetical protein